VDPNVASSIHGMDVSEERKPGVLLLGLSKRFDSTNAKQVEEKILGVIAAGDHRLVLDLTALDYISSAGLRVLLVAANRLKSAEGKFALFGLNDHVRQVFDIAGFSSFLSTHASREEAIEHVL